jgi:hypothetical protein
MSSNKWIYILGIFCKAELHVSKDCGSLTKNKMDRQKRNWQFSQIKFKASCGN